MRSLATLLLWLIATAALAVAVPAGWTERHLVDADGSAALAQQAAADPALQSAMAAELANRAMTLVSKSGADVDPSVVREVATDYTASPEFPPQFAQANRLVHRWMFTDSSDPWTVDVAPMLRDSAFADLLNRHHVDVPDSVPLTLSPPDGLRPGKLQPLASWGMWVSIGATALTGIGAVLMLVSARRRGKALASLGVSALLVGAGGYAAIEVGRRHLNEALSNTTDNMQHIADGFLGCAQDSLQHWLILTLAAGGVLVVVGVIVAMLGGLRKA